MSQIAADIIASCRVHGLDLSATLQVGWYNERVASAHRLPDLGCTESLVVLIGNTRRLWPLFLQAMATDYNLAAQTDPLDHYVESVVRSAQSSTPVASAIRWAHKPEPHHVSFQTLADCASLAWRSPASLSVHPVYGSWIAFRAAIVIAEPLHADQPAMQRPCQDCKAGCERQLRTLLSGTGSAGWRDWLAVRDACPVGREHRYSESQILYHYTKSREVFASG